MTLGTPLLTAYCEQDVQLTADDVKLRCPEGLDQPSRLISVEDQILRKPFCKQVR